MYKGTATTTHLESGDKTYNKAVFQVCSKAKFSPLKLTVVSLSLSQHVNKTFMKEFKLLATSNFQAK